jgi:hypothetical protein
MFVNLCPAKSNDKGAPIAMVTARDLVEAFGVGASSDNTS